MIEVQDLCKSYGDNVAVAQLSFTVRPGTVTGFLGPNGAGKSTTMRLILGLDRPTSGTATIDGKRYAELARPLRVVGALLEAGAVHPVRSAYNHLLYLAQTQATPALRVEEVIDLVGLHDVAHDRAERSPGAWDNGWASPRPCSATGGACPGRTRQRAGPDGIFWFRNLLKHLAGQGRTVLVSSHVLSEVEQTVDDVVIIAKGRLVRAWFRSYLSWLLRRLLWLGLSGGLWLGRPRRKRRSRARDWLRLRVLSLRDASGPPCREGRRGPIYVWGVSS